jgi:transcription antitermination factor NusG
MSGTMVHASGEVHTWPLGFGTALPTDYWSVLHAFPRQDKRLISELERCGIPGIAFYENRVRQYEKSTQTFQVPLLGGYVFAHLPRERRAEAFATGRVVRVIDVSDAAALTRDLERLTLLLTALGDAPLVVRPELAVGQTVEITFGMFSGCSGVIQRRQDNRHLVVNLPVLGQSVSTVIPLDLAELRAG